MKYLKLMKKDNFPLVSIIMPTYNRPDSICKAVESILKQDYYNWELIIIDNGPYDITRKVLHRYLVIDSRIKYYKIEKSNNLGISDYLNYGIKVSNGDYIARLDDDDEWCDSKKLNKQVLFLNRNMDYNLVGGGGIMVDKNGKELYRFLKRENDSEIRNNALYACPFWHSTVMFRKKAAIEAGGYKNRIFGEDWELWLRLGLIGKFHNFKEYFALYLSDGSNFSANNQRKSCKVILEIIFQNKTNYPNFYKAYCLNFMQLLFAYLPLFIRKRVQNFLFFIKRNYF